MGYDAVSALCEAVGVLSILILLQRRFLHPPGDSLVCPVCKHVLCDPVTVRESAHKYLRS
jgi:hypothetical protein